MKPPGEVDAAQSEPILAPLAPPSQLIPAEPAPPAPVRASRISTLLANARNAVRLAFFLRVDDERFPFSWWQILIFVCASIAIPPIFAFAMSDTGGELQWYCLLYTSPSPRDS